jgi:hypothetical protein
VIGQGAFWGAGTGELRFRLTEKAVGEGRALPSAVGCNIGLVSQQLHHFSASDRQERGVRFLVVVGEGVISGLVAAAEAAYRCGFSSNDKLHCCTLNSFFCPSLSPRSVHSRSCLARRRRSERQGH